MQQHVAEQWALVKAGIAADAQKIEELERRLAFYERPTSKFVEVDTKLAAILSGEWSRPVRMQITSEEGNLLRLIAKDVEP
jgi:hypothetical protein